MELNTASLSQFVRLAGVIFAKGLDFVEKNIRGSGLFVEDSIPANSGNTRDYTEIDLNLYAKAKAEGNQAARAKKQTQVTWAKSQPRDPRRFTKTGRAKAQPITIIKEK